MVLGFQGGVDLGPRLPLPRPTPPAAPRPALETELTSRDYVGFTNREPIPAAGIPSAKISMDMLRGQGTNPDSAPGDASAGPADVGLGLRPKLDSEKTSDDYVAFEKPAPMPAAGISSARIAVDMLRGQGQNPDPMGGEPPDQRPALASQWDSRFRYAVLSFFRSNKLEPN